MIHFFLVKYVLNKKVATECQTGSKIVEKSQCVRACVELKVEVDAEPLFDGSPCKSSGSQMCRQKDSNLRANAAFICKTEGN